MPNTLYVAGREPPSLWDRILGTAVSTTLSAGFAIIGALVFTSALSGMEVSQSLSQSATLISALIGALLAVGGTISLIGGLNPGYRMPHPRARVVEQIGAILVASGALAFGAGILMSGNRLALASGVIITAISVGYLLRALAVHVSLKRIRASIEADTRPRG